VVARRPALAGVFAVALSGCLRLDVSSPEEVAITLTSDQATAGIGEEISFRYEATAFSLVEVVLEYGDGEADTILGRGAVSASGFLDHAFQQAGSFIVTGTVSDATAPSQSASVTIQISP
jgi:hypothetical protein